MKKKILLTQHFKDERCPWCYREGVDVSVRKKSIRKKCSNGCIYDAPIPKYELKQSERRKYYNKQ
ncbi:hypothetical protein HOI18_03265 [Candidatus Uhrbacteria bacterium]|jgi:hypothetical protein|nr:hypothetical protein [Candidatus Uhrbacteria bacterium]